MTETRRVSPIRNEADQRPLSLLTLTNFSTSVLRINIGKMAIERKVASKRLIYVENIRTRKRTRETREMTMAILGMKSMRRGLRSGRLSEPTTIAVRRVSRPA